MIREFLEMNSLVDGTLFLLYIFLYIYYNIVCGVDMVKLFCYR